MGGPFISLQSDSVAGVVVVVVVCVEGVGVNFQNHSIEYSVAISSQSCGSISLR